MDNDNTRFEKARMIGSRALQLSMGAPFLVKLTKKQLEEVQYNPIRIATLEYDEGVLPIAVRRPMPKKRAKNVHSDDSDSDFEEEPEEEEVEESEEEEVFEDEE